MRVTKERSQIIVVDIQEKLAPHLTAVDEMLAQVEKLLTAATLFDIPVTIAEQYPKGLGHTVSNLKSFVSNNVIEKESFSCFGEPKLVKTLETIKSEGKDTLIVIGCEAHVCVLQTVIDALSHGYRVVVVNDCIGSRKLSDKVLAQTRLTQYGAEFVSTEMVLFEWAVNKNNEHFKAVSKLVK